MTLLMGFSPVDALEIVHFARYRRKKGISIRLADVDGIVRHKKVKFLDNNFLALPEHKEILAELVKKKIKCQFNQGLDITIV